MSQPSAPPAYDYGLSEKKYNDGQAPYPAPVAQEHGAAYAQPYNTHPAETTTFQPADPIPSTENEGFTVGGTFSDKALRRMFIRKVYITLFLQLLVTFGIVFVFTFVEEVKSTVKSNPGMYYAAYGVFLALYLVLACCEGVRRKSPINVILLILFTLALSYMVGTIASFYDTQSVLVALGVTAVVCLAVTLFSIQTRFDFTKCSGVLFVLLLVLMLFGFITIFTYSYNWYIHVVYGSLGALVFTLFLAFDTQLIVGGKRYEMDPEEYIYAALNLYIDVVYIFIFLLSLIGGSK